MLRAFLVEKTDEAWSLTTLLIAGDMAQIEHLAHRMKGAAMTISAQALAALVPKPRVNLTRFHGVFAPNSHHRVTITPSKRGKGAKRGANTEPASLSEPDDRTPMEQRAAKS